MFLFTLHRKLPAVGSPDVKMPIGRCNIFELVRWCEQCERVFSDEPPLNYFNLSSEQKLVLAIRCNEQQIDIHAEADI